MEKQNITLSLPKDLLLRVKHLAIDRHTSISGLLANTLEELVSRQNAYEKSRKHYLNLLDSLDMNTKGNVTWKRDDLHER